MFYRVLAVLLLTFVMARAEEPEKPLPDFAGIYPANSTVPSIALLSSLAPGARIIEKNDGDVTEYICDWPDVTVRIRVDAKWDQANQIKEMKRWITHLAKEQKDNPIITGLVTKLEGTKNCFGCVISPRYDHDDKAIYLLLALTKECDGLIYAYHTFYDTDGNRILGTEGDPSRMQYIK